MAEFLTCSAISGQCLPRRNTFTDAIDLTRKRRRLVPPCAKAPPAKAKSSAASSSSAPPSQTSSRRKERRGSSGSFDEASSTSGRGHPPPAEAPAARSKSSTSAPHRSQKLYLDSSCHDISWDACTVRGWEDGSLVFKFDQLDPPVEEEVSLGRSPSTLANFAWSNALKLGVKFPQQLAISLRKLEEFAAEYNAGSGGYFKVDFRHSMFKSYDKAARRHGRLLYGDDDGNEAVALRVGKEILSDSDGSSSGEDGSSVEQEGLRNEGISRQEAEAVAELASSIKALARETAGEVAPRGATTAAGAGQGPSKDTAPYMPPWKQKQFKRKSGENTPAAAGGAVSSVNPALLLTAESQPKTIVEKLVHAARTFGNNLYQLYYSVLLPSLRFLSSALSPLRLSLAVYRTLPYSFRRTFHSSWPPKITEYHVSPIINQLFLEPDGFNKATLAHAGFDSQGRCTVPGRQLHDLPAWRIEQLLGCGIRNTKLYRSALTHPTALAPEARVYSYERLEYLGDAVLELCTREMLMKKAPDAHEGQLTTQGQIIVAGSMVNKYAEWMGLNKWVICNAYSLRNDGLRASPHILGDAFEALLGALYADRGLEAARELLMRVLTQCPSVQWVNEGESRDFKGTLLKLSHQRKVPLPQYQVLSAHPKRYKDTAVRKKYWTVQVEFDGQVMGSASSFEKSEAERIAARQALVALGALSENQAGEESAEDHY